MRVAGNKSGTARLASSDAALNSRRLNSGSRSDNHSNNLTVTYLNARSVKSVNRERNKLVQLNNLISLNKPSIVAITETWLTADINDNELLPANYALYRKDRSDTCPGKRGGGVFIGVDSCVKSMRRADLESPCEILVCEVRPQNHSRLAIVLCYRPPDSDAKQFTQHLHDVMTKVSREFKVVCLLGDFNFPNIDWSFPNLCSGTDLQFVELTDHYSLEQLNTVHSNIHGNLLDLVFCNDADVFEDIVELQCDFTTDHAVLMCNLKVRKPHIAKVKRIVYNYKRANFPLLREELNAISLATLVTDCTDIDTAWSKWREAVESRIDKCVPQVEVKDSTAPPWFDSEIRHLFNLKTTIWKKAKKSNKPSHWAKFRKIRNELKSAMSRSYKEYIQNLGTICKDNPKRFWSFFRSKTKRKCLPMCLKKGNTEVNEPKEKASLFNDYFHSVFQRDTEDDPLPEVNYAINDALSTIRFTCEQVNSALRALDIAKACGPDKLSPRVLKECSAELAPSLTALYNMSLQLGRIPVQWKQANVTPIYKKGDKQLAENYRPVSLLCIVSKVLERCIYDRIIPQVKQLIHPLQHGFVKGRSCATQLLEVYNNIGSELDQGGQVDMVYLDFSKAFDSVSHRLLIRKLKMYGFHGNLLDWLIQYLSGRQQRIVLEGETSDWLPVTSGVPQGSILGPLLFLLYINDMPLITHSTTLALFADDAKCFKAIRSQDDAQQLQSDLDRLSTWSDTWKLKFNSSKCKVMSVTRKSAANRIDYDYSLNNLVLEHVGTFKDLGVVIDSTLSWRANIQTLLTRTKRVCGMIKRSIGYSAPVSVSAQLYKSLARCHLEYCSPVWSPHYTRDVKAIESIQRGMTRYILGYPPRSTTYVDRCLQLDVLPLSLRREVADLTLFHRCLHGTYDLELSKFVSFVPNNTNLRSASRGRLLRVNRVNSESFKADYFNRISSIWNSLPQDLRECVNFKSFKKGVLCNYKLRLVDRYDPDVASTWSAAR